MDLPAAEYRAGFAEAIKHGMIADAGYFDWIETHASDSSRGPRRPWWI